MSTAVLDRRGVPAVIADARRRQRRRRVAAGSALAIVVLAALGAYRLAPGGTNASSAGARQTSTPVVSVYLKTGATSAQVSRVLAAARTQPGYRAARVVTAPQGLNLMLHRYPALSTRRGANPIGPAINLRLTATADLARYAARLRKRFPGLIRAVARLTPHDLLDDRSLIPSG